VKEMMMDRWNEQMLDSLRLQGDPAADDAIRRILANEESGGMEMVFDEMDINDAIPAVTLFPIAADFFQLTDDLPPGTDLDRMRRGEEIFWRHAYAIALAVLAKCLPERFASPSLAVLLRTQADTRPQLFRRLLDTLHLVLNVSSCTGFGQGGRALITAQKVRLLHAGIRSVVRRMSPEFERRYGTPVNQEDMIAMIVGYSFTVLRGLRTLGVGLRRKEEEDFFYVWKVFGLMIGIHPPGEPYSMDYLPRDMADADLFMRQYSRRHYLDSSQNPEGITLITATLDLLRLMVPQPHRSLGFAVVSRIAMQELMGEDACRRVGIAPVRGHDFRKWMYLQAHHLLKPHHGRGAHVLPRIIFQDMIKGGYNGEVTIKMPVGLRKYFESVRAQDGGRTWTSQPSSSPARRVGEVKR
jgi:hypothetical protein